MFESCRKRSNRSRKPKAQISAIFFIWHAPCKTAGMADGWSGGRSGRQTMSFNLNIQQFLVSAVGALFAATLFISATVGPAGQLV